MQYGCGGRVLVGDGDADPTVCITATGVQYGCMDKDQVGDGGGVLLLCPLPATEAGETPAPLLPAEEVRYRYGGSILGGGGG